MTGALDDTDRRILALAVPALAALAIEPLYVLVDTGIVGRLGTGPLAGLALASTVLSGVTWLCNFLSFATTSRVAFLMGQDDRRRAARVAGSGMWLSLVMGLPLALLVAGVGPAIGGWLGGHGPALRAATTYLRISGIGMPFVLLALVGHGFLRGRSDTRTPLRVVAVANVLNLALEVMFVYGFHWGVAGSAWGTVLAQVLAAAWLVHLVRERAATDDASVRPDPVETRMLLNDGRRITLRTLALVAAFTLATSAAARFGSAQLAAHQIAMQMFLLLALSVDALAVAAQALIGTSLGAGQDSDAATTGTRVLRLGIIAGVALGAVLAAASPVLPRAFTGDGAVVHHATVALALLGAMQVPAAAAFALDGALMGASDFGFLQWATLGALAVFAPWIVVLARWKHLGMAGLWGGLVGWMCVRAIANVARVRRVIPGERPGAPGRVQRSESRLRASVSRASRPSPQGLRGRNGGGPIERTGSG